MLIVIVGVLLIAIFTVRSIVLNAFASEGDVPDASAVQLPAGAEILSTRVECASGGCWRIVQVHPAEGRTAMDLAEQIGATPTLEIAPSLFEPRTTWVTSEVKGGVLELHLDYWSGPSNP